MNEFFQIKKKKEIHDWMVNLNNERELNLIIRSMPMPLNWSKHERNRF